MLAAQGGLCAICVRPESAGHSRGKDARAHLAIDHDHVTGVVRGLLCLRCNHALERLETVPEWHRSAVVLANLRVGMNVLFIPDARGNGHRIRCQALAEELERRGHLAVVINASESVPSRTFKAVVIDLRGDIGLASAVERTIRIIDDPEGQNGACDLLVLGCATTDDFILHGNGPRSVGNCPARNMRYCVPSLGWRARSSSMSREQAF